VCAHNLKFTLIKFLIPQLLIRFQLPLQQYSCLLLLLLPFYRPKLLHAVHQLLWLIRYQRRLTQQHLQLYFNQLMAAQQSPRLVHLHLQLDLEFLQLSQEQHQQSRLRFQQALQLLQLVLLLPLTLKQLQ
jgi:hypothetical protein